ncbi:MAG: phage major capsid protein, partial [Ilumatobacteraceae bacterium]
MNKKELQAKLDEIRNRIVELSERDQITDEENVELDALLPEFEGRKAELAAVEAREARIAEVRAATTERHAGYDVPEVMKRTSTELDVARASRQELRDAALAILDRDGKSLAARNGDHVDSLLRTRNALTDGSVIAKRMILTENDDYRSAFMKAVTSAAPAFTADEARAMTEARAMSEGVDTAGGFGIPVLIDPSIILTSGAAAAPVLDLARVVTITTDEWKGVSSAGVSWSYDGEGTEVSDDSPTLAQPTVPVYTARGFIPYSIEVGSDYPSFAAEMRRLLDAGYIDLVANGTINGTGSSQPTGIFTALDANTNVEVVVTTDGTFGGPDLLKTWKSLPERYRASATWIMNTDVENEIRAFSAGADSAYYTVDLAAGGIGTLFGRPIRTTDYAPEFTGTTGAANILVVGDFSNFLVAQRAGMSLELIPHLFGTTNGRPTGQ